MGSLFFVLLPVCLGVGPATGSEPVAGAGAEAPAPHVSFEDGGVTVRSSGVSLRDLLGEIALRGGFAVESNDPLCERVTLEFERLPLPQALRRVLGRRDYLLRLADLSGSPERLWVFGKSRESPEGHTTHPTVGDSPEFLPDDDPALRLRAVSTLAGAGDPRAASILASAALFDDDAAVRVEALHGLGEIGDAAGLAALERALSDSDSRVRRAALAAASDIGGEAAVGTLALALFDAEAALREEAVHALGEVGGAAAVAELERALADEHPFVRDAAAEWLWELAGEDGPVGTATEAPLD